MGTFADVLVAVVAVAALVLSLKNYQVQKVAPLKARQRQLRDGLHRQIVDVLSALEDGAKKLNVGQEVGPPPTVIVEYATHANSMTDRLRDRGIAGGRLALSGTRARSVAEAWLSANEPRSSSSIIEHLTRIQITRRVRTVTYLFRPKTTRVRDFEQNSTNRWKILKISALP